MWFLRRWMQQWQLNRVRTGRNAAFTQLQVATSLVHDIRASRIGGSPHSQEGFHQIQRALSRLEGLGLITPVKPEGWSRTNPQIQQQLIALNNALREIEDLIGHHSLSLDDELERRLNAYFITYPSAR